MGNYLKIADPQLVKALLELGWSYRRIQREAALHAKARLRPLAAGETTCPLFFLF